jgi:hypothetical protein
MLGSDAVKVRLDLHIIVPTLANAFVILSRFQGYRKAGRGLTLLFGKVSGIFLRSEREPGSLDIVRPASPSMTTP